jgi:hypothetical protein
MHLPPHPFFSTILDMDPTSGISLSLQRESETLQSNHTPKKTKKKTGKKSTTPHSMSQERQKTHTAESPRACCVLSPLLQ